jgi:hypothetical protein
MEGDERARFCSECNKHVYNLSAMTERQAADLVWQTEGRMCVRFYRRKDGTALTQDCPVGVWAWRRRLILGATAAAVLFLTLIGVGIGMMFGRETGGGRNGRGNEDNFITRIRNFFAPEPPCIMGEMPPVVVPPPPGNVAPPAPGVPQ